MKICLAFSLLMASALCQEPSLKKTDIETIFNKYVKVNYNEEYKNRYCPLPLEKNNLSWRWEGKDLPRVIALLEFERFIKENRICAAKALAVEGYYPGAGYDPECLVLPALELFTTAFQSNPEKHDLHTLELEHNDFDFVIVNQVLEHVYDPIRCLKNIYKFMEKGGILYINVPVNNIPHDTPFHHYTGITPVGLGAIVQSAGFKILKIGQWGNYQYTQLLFQRNEWPDYRALRNPGLNDIGYPIITWIFAQKE